VRDRVYHAIADNPGITIIGISRLVGVRHQTVCYHLKKLKRSGHVVAHPKGNRLLHFVNGAVASEATRDLILVANDPVTIAILDRIIARPGLLRKEVAGTSGLTRTGAAWHVNKLVRHGIVREQRVGGQCHLYVVESQEQALRALTQQSREPAPPAFPVSDEAPAHAPIQ
jgi:predicted transcriptional regulator